MVSTGSRSFGKRAAALWDRYKIRRLKNKRQQLSCCPRCVSSERFSLKYHGQGEASMSGEREQKIVSPSVMHQRLPKHGVSYRTLWRGNP